MTGSTRTIGRLTAVVLVAGAMACSNYLEVPVETPLEATLDVSKFQRVLIAGFLAGGTDEVDTNLETARLLRSQMRSNRELQVIDSEVLDLVEIAGREEGITIERQDPPAPVEGDPGAPGQTEGTEEEDDESLSEEDLELVRDDLRERQLLASARRGVSKSAHRHRHGLLLATPAIRHGDPRAGGL